MAYDIQQMLSAASTNAETLTDRAKENYPALVSIEIETRKLCQKLFVGEMEADERIIIAQRLVVLQTSRKQLTDAIFNYPQ